MDTISKATIISLIPINKDISIKTEIPDSEFLNSIKKVNKEEFNESYHENITSSLIRTSSLKYNNYLIDYSIYSNYYSLYDSSLVYVEFQINSNMKYDDFSNFINSKNYFYSSFDNEDKTLIEILVGLGVTEQEIKNDFLFIQIENTIPAIPKNIQETNKFIKYNEQKILKLLLCSNTSHKFIRRDNHKELLENVSNFHGTQDFCSSSVLIQIYQEDLTLVNNNEEFIVPALERRVWWLSMLNVVVLQKSILFDAVKSINKVETINKEKSVKAAVKIEQVLQDMKEFWYFEGFQFDISKAIVKKLKTRINIQENLENVLEQVKSLENRVLREINEEQNKYNQWLNRILFFIALLQVTPLVYEILSLLIIGSSSLSIQQVRIWIQSILISFSLPVMYLIVNKFRYKTSKDNELILQNNLNNNYLK